VSFRPAAELLALPALPQQDEAVALALSEFNSCGLEKVKAPSLERGWRVVETRKLKIYPKE
jgi:hypothetical protein